MFYLDPRRLATLVATVAYVEARSVDDCLELLDLLVTTELLGKAERATDKERARRHPDLARHSSRLAAAIAEYISMHLWQKTRRRL